MTRLAGFALCRSLCFSLQAKHFPPRITVAHLPYWQPSFPEIVRATKGLQFSLFSTKEASDSEPVEYVVRFVTFVSACSCYRFLIFFLFFLSFIVLVLVSLCSLGLSASVRVLGALLRAFSITNLFRSDVEEDEEGSESKTVS